MRRVARSLQQAAEIEDGNAHDAELRQMYTWVALLQNSADTLLPHTRRRDRPVDKIRQVMLCDALRTDVALKPVLVLAAQMLLPAAQASDVTAALQTRQLLEGRVEPVQVRDGHGLLSVVEGEPFASYDGARWQG